MRAADFVLGTLSHFVRRAEGPFPGVPARVDPGFETRLSAICVDQGLSTIISRSLDTLALPPSISRVTAARLRKHGGQTVDNARRRAAHMRALIQAFHGAGVPALVMGDALSEATLYDVDSGRPIRRLELLVGESHAGDALRTAAALGFTRRRTDPSLDPTSSAPPTLREARDILEFHHYMSPQLLWNNDGDCLRLRYRVVDVGRPDDDERAWDAARLVSLDGDDAHAVSLEDHIVDLVVRLGISGYSDLCALMDLGMILHRHSGDVQWGPVVFRGRIHGLYAPLHHALQRAARALDLGVGPPLDPPSTLYQKWLDAFWSRDTIDYTRGPGDPRRFRYGLIACGGPLARLHWVWRHAVPRRDWVERIVGDASRPWNWLRFQLMVRERANSRGRGARRIGAGHDNVTRIDRED